MNKVLRKRIPREIRANFFRYISLFLLIAFSMFIIIALIDAAETIIQGTEENQRRSHVEDGQVTVFTPLTDIQLSEIRSKGVTIEDHISYEAVLEDDSILRIFKVREQIDTVNLDEGRLPEAANELVVEKRYCEVHGVGVGDVLKVAGRELVVTGIGTTVDYDAPFRKFSDTAIDSRVFGTAFMTDEGYSLLRAAGHMATEDLTYAFILNDAMTSDELKQMIQDFEFDYKQVDDEYYREMLDDTYGKKEEIEDGISELVDGADELYDGVTEFKEGTSELKDGMKELYDGSVKLADGTDRLRGGLPELAGAVNELKNGVREAYDGSMELDDGADELLDGVQELRDGVKELKEQSDDMLDEVFSKSPDNVTSFVLKDENIRIGGGAGDVVINKQVGAMAGVIIIVLFTYVLSVFVIHQIQNESSVIGALYAMGVKKRDLLKHYITLPTWISFLGGLAGAAAGFSRFGCEWQMADTYGYYSLPQLDKVVPAYLVVYSVVMPPVVSLIVNTLVINKRLSQTALSLIRNEQKAGRGSNVNLGNMSFIRRFRVRQMLRERRTAFTVVFGMLISLLIFMMGMDSYVLCRSVGRLNSEDTKYEYMYTYKYPTKEVPEGGEAVYINTLKKEKYGYSLDITVIGIDDDNPYYDVTTIPGKNKIIASDAITTRYGVGKGDKIIFSDNAGGIDYAFTIADVVPYSVGLSVFMDIDSMRELFGEDDDYYNVVLSDHKLDIEEGRLYSVLTKEDVDKAADIFTDLMRPMVVMMIGVSIIIFCVVMYLMMAVMIDRASFGISLVKIFGYNNREIKKLYLDGNRVIVILGALIGVPVSKKIMDAMFPSFVSNVTCPVHLEFRWYYYVMIFAAIMVCYFVINMLLTRKLGKVTPAEVLKNRE